MSWLKIDDQIATHPKILKAGPSASWLWICSIAYSSNHFTDGFISDAALGHLGIPKHVLKQLVSRLLKQALWERVKGGFQVHDYLQHNPSAVERRQGLAAKQKAGQIGGHRSWQLRHKTGVKGPKHAAEADVKQPAEADVKQPAEPRSDPIRSDPYKKADAPAARSADTVRGTNTAGNGSAGSRRDTPDGGPAAPASAPVVPPLSPELRKRFGVP